MLKYIHSGGQTGIDLLGLICAKECGINTGGVAPKYYRTENGSNYKLKDFGLVENSTTSYSSRTEKNVINCDGTVLFGDMSSPGTKETIKFLNKHNKSYIQNPTSEELYNFIILNKIEILNVAGNRGSKLTQDEIKKYSEIMLNCFGKFKN